MVLVHGGGPGAEKIAARWAESNAVHQVVCKPDWKAHQRAAPFRHNDELLNLLPKGVVAFPAGASPRTSSTRPGSSASPSTTSPPERCASPSTAGPHRGIGRFFLLPHLRRRPARNAPRISSPPSAPQSPRRLRPSNCIGPNTVSLTLCIKRFLTPSALGCHT